MRTTLSAERHEHSIPEFDHRVRRAAVPMYVVASLLALVVAEVPAFDLGYSRAGVTVLAVLGLASAAIILRFPWHRYDRNLFLVMSLSAAAMVAALIRMTGGAASPFEVYWFLVAIFAAMYYGRIAASLVAVVVSACTLLPLAYGEPDAQFVVRSLVMSATYFIIILVANVLPMELLRRERARRGLEADLQEVVALRDGLAAAHELERRRTMQLRAVHDISREVGSVLYPSRLHDELVRVIHERLGYDLVGLLVPDAQRSGYVLVAAAGREVPRHDLETGRLRVPAGCGIIGHVAGTRRAYRSGEVGTDAHYIQLVEKGPIRSELAVPIMLGDELLGVLDVESERPDEFDDVDVMALEAVADQAAVALENARAHERVAEQAKTDSLTGLLNHRSLLEGLDAEIARAHRFGHPLAALFLDIDHFKGINDAHGHQAGDAALQELARLARQTLREVDTLGRYGGEEFVAVLPEVGAEEAVGAGERLRAAVEAEALVLGAEGGMRFTVSIGVASYPEDGETRQELLAAADRAMYDAKQAGRNRVRASAARVHAEEGRRLPA